MADLFESGPLARWTPPQADWAELKAFRAKKRRFRDLLEELVGNPQDLLERGYIIQKLGVTPTDVAADRVQGEVRVWVAPNPGFWKSYRRILELGEPLAREGEGVPAGLFGSVRGEEVTPCMTGSPCVRLGFRQPTRIPKELAPVRAQPLILHLDPGNGRMKTITVWKNLIIRLEEGTWGDSGDRPLLHALALQRTHTFQNGQARLCPPFIKSRNESGSGATPLRTHPGVPEAVGASANAVFSLRRDQSGLVRAFDGGVILGLDVTAPDVASLKALASEPLEVTAKPGPRGLPF